MARLSLVIPAYNESRLLPRLLETVETARRAYRHGRDAVEVIVADNASTDGTVGLAEAGGCRVASVEKRCIAAVRNGGARIAHGEILAFVDADSRIHPSTFDAIDDALSRADVIGGATGVRPERWSTGLALTFAMCLPVVWLTGLDSGVVFCRRADFEAVGGYDERRELAEDVAFLWALRRLGKRSGRKLTRIKRVKVIASTRKFDRYGDWHYFTKILPLAIPLVRDPFGKSELARKYWYTDDR